MEARRQVEEERGRDFADVTALLNMNESPIRRELKYAHRGAPTMYGNVAITSRLHDGQTDKYFYDRLAADEKQLVIHVEDSQESQELGKVGFFSPKRMMGNAAVLLASGGAAAEAASLVHMTVEGGVSAASYTSIGLVIARMWYMRRTRPLKLAQKLDQITEKATDVENGAVMISGELLNIGSLGRGGFTESNEVLEHVGLEQAYIKETAGLGKFHRGDVRVSPSDVFEKLLAADAEPDELWTTWLHDKLVTMSELQAERRDTKRCQEEAHSRAAFSGIDTDPADQQTLESETALLQTKTVKFMHEVLLHGQKRFHDRQKTEAINKYRHLLEETITTSDKELNHPLAGTLSVFKEVLFQSLIELDSTDEAPIKKEDLWRINAYLQQIPTHLTDVKHAEQIYTGMVKRFSEVVGLPSWDEVKDRFEMAD
jgi:hypothetical protein